MVIAQKQENSLETGVAKLFLKIIIHTIVLMSNMAHKHRWIWRPMHELTDRLTGYKRRLVVLVVGKF